MPTFRHRVIIRGTPRHRLDAVVAALFAIAESTPLSTTGLVTVPSELHLLDPTGRTWVEDDASSEEPPPQAGARLVAGEHLKPGARYLLTGGRSVSEVTVRLWPRLGHSGHPAHSGRSGQGDMEVSIATPRDATPDDVTDAEPRRRWWRRERRRTPRPVSTAPVRVSGDLHLAGGATPRHCTASVNLVPTSAPKLLTQISADVRADVDAWFEAAANRRPSTSRPPVVIGIRHRLGTANVRVRLVETRGDAWKVAVTVVLRGGSILRPAIAMVLFAKRRAIGRQFRDGLDEFAAHWNGTATGREHPEGTAADPRTPGAAQQEVDDTTPAPPPRRTMTPQQWKLVARTIHLMAERGHEPWLSWSHRLASQEKSGETPRAQFEAFHEAFTRLRPLEQGEALLAGMVETLTSSTDGTT